MNCPAISFTSSIDFASSKAFGYGETLLSALNDAAWRASTL
jgi:hypothetical protein